MIYTVTFNPAVDYVVRADELCVGEVNRSRSEEIFFGGKGINVSIVLKELGVSSKALGFIAGFTGRAIRDGVAALGVDADFIELGHGASRINVKIKAGEETELNGQGPDISAEALRELFDRLSALRDGDTLVLAGSIPRSLPSDVYEKMISSVSDREINVVVDATNDLLMNVLKYKPFLIKPNIHELREMLAEKIESVDDVITNARKLKALGARNVLVSMAGDGAVLLDENGAVHVCGACRGTVKNSVGAGDSMVAGFIAGAQSGDYEYALKLGTAAGGATAFSDGLAKKDDIMRLLKELK